MKYDALVVGGGIGGMESALKLGDMGYKVLLVESEGSVGGRMILLSKVFPTLDCASCISTPKMGATIHHPNVTVLTYSEVDGIEREERRLQGEDPAEAPLRGRGRLHRLPAVRDGLQRGRARRVQRRHGLAAGGLHRVPAGGAQEGRDRAGGHFPLHLRLPGGHQAHGYIALIRSGEYEKAFELVCDATPLVGSLGRACYAPCEEECTRGEPGGLALHPSAQALHRRHPLRQGPSAAVEIPPPNGKKVAIVGSGPAGLTAAWHLARKGYEVKIFEAASQPGGMLRLALPPYRLPNEVVDDDVANVTDCRRDDRHRFPRGRPGSPEGRGLRRHAAGDRHAPGHQAARARRGPGRRHARGRLPQGRQARRAARRPGQAGGGHRRRQRRHRRGPHRPAPRRRDRCSW